MSTTVTVDSGPEIARDIAAQIIGPHGLDRCRIEWVANHPRYITKIHCPTPAMAADLRATFRSNGYRAR